MTRNPQLRPATGRMLGGVCAGIAQARSISVVRVRLAFVAAALLGGFGLVIYVACCLIVPGEQDDPARNGIAVSIALAGAALAGLATLAAIGAAATVFGFGWVAVALSGAVLLAFLLFGRVGPAWALLPIAALTLPSVAIATAGLTMAAQTGDTTYHPLSLMSARTATYRSGLGTMLVDLRSTRLPAGGTVLLRIDGGIRRTIVALPDDECVNTVVHYDVKPFLARAAAILDNRAQPFAGVVLFGKLEPAFAGDAQAPSQPVAGPTLVVDFSSQGGGLYVRDYSRAIDPQLRPDWPGYPVTPESPPDTRGMTRKGAAALVRQYRVRYRRELASMQLMNRLIPGPCGR